MNASLLRDDFGSLGIKDFIIIILVQFLKPNLIVALCSLTLSSLAVLARVGVGTNATQGNPAGLLKFQRTNVAVEDARV